MTRLKPGYYVNPRNELVVINPDESWEILEESYKKVRRPSDSMSILNHRADMPLIKIEGYYLGYKQTTNNRVHVFETYRGKIYVWGRYNLNHAIEGMPPGTMVRVERTCTGAYQVLYDDTLIISRIKYKWVRNQSTYPGGLRYLGNL